MPLVRASPPFGPKAIRGAQPIFLLYVDGEAEPRLTSGGKAGADQAATPERARRQAGERAMRQAAADQPATPARTRRQAGAGHAASRNGRCGKVARSYDQSRNRNVATQSHSYFSITK